MGSITKYYGQVEKEIECAHLEAIDQLVPICDLLWHDHFIDIEHGDVLVVHSASIQTIGQLEHLGWPVVFVQLYCPQVVQRFDVWLVTRKAGVAQVDQSLKDGNTGHFCALLQLPINTSN